MQLETEAEGRIEVDEDMTKRLHAIQEKLNTKVDLEELNEMEGNSAIHSQLWRIRWLLCAHVCGSISRL